MAGLNFDMTGMMFPFTPLTYDRTLLEITLAGPHATATALRTTREEMLDSQAHQERLIDALLTLASSQRTPDIHEPVDLARRRRR